MMPSLRHVRSAAATALAFTLAACGGDGGPSAPGASVSLHLLDAAAITEANTFPVRMRGTLPDSVTAVRIGGTEAIAGVTDSTLLVLMPIGPAGSVTLEATAWIGSRSVPATLSLTRVAGPTVGDPVAATATLLSELDAEIAALPTPSGVDDATRAADQADIAAMRDSLEAQLGRLDPTSRALALSIIAQIRDDGIAAALLANAEQSCSTLKERISCLTGVRLELVKKLARAAKWLILVGSGSFVLVGLTAASVTTVAVASIAAGLVAAVLSYGVIDARDALYDFVSSGYEKAVEPIVRFAGDVSEPLDQGVGPSAMSASAVAPIAMLPDVPRRLPIRRLTRSTIVGDTFPAVRGIADSVNLLAERWAEISASLPRPLRSAAPTIGTSPLRVVDEPADFEEVSIVSIREGGQTAPVTGTLSDAAPGIDLTLSGDPGAGRDLTVRFALDGYGAGRVEFDVPIRYEAAPDTLDALRVLFEGQAWGWEGATAVQPWVVTRFDRGSSIEFRYCYGDYVRCFNYRFVKADDGSLYVIVTSGFNGNVTYWEYVVITAGSVYIRLLANDPASASVTFTPR